MAMNMRGSLNVSKFQKTPAQPRFYGKALIHGVSYDIKGWEKETNGEPWISLLFEDPLHGQPVPETKKIKKPSIFSQQKPLPMSSFDDMDDDTPF